MNNREFISALFEYPRNAFKEHLAENENHRIVFSGKFGIGKTYFLKNFFDEATQKEILGDIHYTTFNLFPVNYSIAANEDIFKYIRYDVITSMLLNGVQVKESDFTFMDTLPYYLRGNLDKIFATLLYMVPKVGKDVVESYEKLKELKKEFTKHHEKLNDSEGNQLIQYLDSIEKTEGSIYEFDLISKLIHEILARLKNQSKKQNILVIDDLDRIDPEHIFRVLNVFASHLENPDNLPNKLGFDKVIIVCDIKNIRNIFAAKYGQSTDFSGYIDKFYSKEIFYFDNKKILKELSTEVFQNVEYRKLNPHEAVIYSDRLFSKKSLVVDILHSLIYAGFVNLKALLNVKRHAMIVDAKKKFAFSNRARVDFFDHPILIHFEILKNIVGDYSNLCDLISRTGNEYLPTEDMNSACNELLYYVTADIHLFNDRVIEIQYELRNKKIFFQFNPEQHILKKNTLIETNSRPEPSKENYDFDVEDFKFLVLTTIEKIKLADKPINYN